MAEARSSNVTALLSATAANFGQFGARVAISPFVLAIAMEFSTTKSLIGLILTGMWATYALMQFPSGVFADRYGERSIVLVALGMAVLGSIFVAASPSLVVFAIAALLLGLGAGMYFAPGTALLDRRFTGTGRVFSIHSAGGPLAGLAVPVIGTWVAATYGWRSGILVGGAGALGALAMGLVFVEARPPTNPDAALRSRLNRRTVTELLSRPVVAFSTVLGVIGMYVFQATVSFFPTFLQEHHGLTQGDAGVAMGVAFLLIALVLPFVGEVADRWGADYAIATAFLVTASGFATLILGPGSSVALWGGVALIGVGLTWGGAIQSRVMREFGDDERGTGFGLVRTVFILFGSVGNVATGVLADIFGWGAAYGVVVGLLCFGVLILATNRLLDLDL